MFEYTGKNRTPTITHQQQITLIIIIPYQSISLTLLFIIMLDFLFFIMSLFVLSLYVFIQKIYYGNEFSLVTLIPDTLPSEPTFPTSRCNFPVIF